MPPTSCGAPLHGRSRARSARTNSRAARRWPSAEGWKPSSANVARSSAAGWSEPSSRTDAVASRAPCGSRVEELMPFSTRARERGRRSRKREMSG